MAERRAFLADHDEEEDIEEKPVTKHARQQRSRFYWRVRQCACNTITILAILVSVILGVSLMTSRRPPHRLPLLDRSIHVFLVAEDNRESIPRLCTDIASLSALDYPVPSYVNLTWGGLSLPDLWYSDTNQTGWVSKRGRGKVEGISHALWSPDLHEDSLVVVTDAFDTIFQLRPSVLIERYHTMNREAQRRNSYRQTVVFSASRRCIPHETPSPWCYLQQEAAMANGVTELQASQTPIYLDAGYIMGPARRLRKIIDRAEMYQRPAMPWGGEHLLRQQNSSIDAQAALSMIFAEQQLYRAISKQRSNEWYAWTAHKISTVLSKGRTMDDVPNERKRLSLVPDRDYEFGIGLDYFSNLVHVEDLEDPIKSSDMLVYHKQKSFLGKSGDKNRNLVLPGDIARSPPPVRGVTASPASRQVKWSEVKLFTNKIHNIIPAAILYRGPVAESVYTIWELMWLYEHASDLMKEQRWRADGAKAELVGGSTILGADESFDRAVDVLKNDVNIGDITRAEEDPPMLWSETCQSLEKDIFY